jgi:hypothetical protein
LAAQLADEGDALLTFEYHAEQIRRRFARHADVAMHQDGVAGFLHGFLMAGGFFVPDGTMGQQAMFPVLGGALLAGQDLPAGDEDEAGGREMLDELAATAPT